MGKLITNKIDKIEIIKIEKVFNNPEVKEIYYYNLYLDGIDDPLIFSSQDSKLDTSIAGAEIRYKLSDDNEVSQFEII